MLYDQINHNVENKKIFVQSKHEFLDSQLCLTHKPLVSFIYINC